MLLSFSCIMIDVVITNLCKCHNFRYIEIVAFWSIHVALVGNRNIMYCQMSYFC